MAIFANCIVTWSFSLLYRGDLWWESVASVTVQVYCTRSYVDIVDLTAVAVYTKFSTIDVGRIILRVYVA